jgi:ribosomal protein S18 acetylase RimI-like enzyme
VNVSSLGYRTDLALLERAGSTIEDHGDHLVVRTPSNPTFYWGNFLLLDHVPDPDRIDTWIERFTSSLPGAGHRAFGFDCRGRPVADLAGWVARGFKTEASAVMTATAVRPPPIPNGEATYRRLRSEDDWARSLELQIACHEGYEERDSEFLVRRTASNRALVADGRGSWFGAFLDGKLVSQMGLVAAGAEVARFQSVETHPDARRRGLAGTLVHVVSRYGLDELRARTLVMVADPEYAAIRIYRSVGFTVGETDLSAELARTEG